MFNRYCYIICSIGLLISICKLPYIKQHSFQSIPRHTISCTIFKLPLRDCCAVHTLQTYDYRKTSNLSRTLTFAFTFEHIFSNLDPQKTSNLSRTLTAAKYVYKLTKKSYSKQAVKSCLDTSPSCITPIQKCLSTYLTPYWKIGVKFALAFWPQSTELSHNITQEG